MSILSLNFVIFTLATVIVYYILPLKIRWLVILAASAVFYALAGWEGCIWLVLVAAITFFSSLLQERLRKREKSIADTEEAIRKAQEEQGKAAKVITDAAGQDAAPADGAPAVTADRVSSMTADGAPAMMADGSSVTADGAPAAADEGTAADGTPDLQQIWEFPDERAQVPTLPSKGWFSSSRKAKKLRKILLAVSIILPLAAMAFTKYYDCIWAWFTTMPALALIMPLGLSYFTFQSVGYMIDIYRGKYPAEKNPLKLLLFVSFFPQMTQGPISPYPQLMPQLVQGHRFDPDNFMMGVQLALWGFFKKMVLADQLVAVTSAIDTGQRGWFILLTVIIYMIRLYADFSGGMDVIRGAAKMLGIDMVENFKRPFFSHSVAEYWRRWHISLGVWFRNYLFYPITTSGMGLALSKFGRKVFGKKAGRAFPATVSTIIIFFLIGIWHTANGNALVFGLYFGLTMGIELLLEPWFKKLKKKFHVKEKSFWWKAFTMFRTWILILIPQYFAFTANASTGWTLLKNTFTNWSFANGAVQFTDVMYPLLWYISAGAFAVMLAVDIFCEFKPDLNERIAKGPFFIRWPVLLYLILSILIFGCYGTGYDATAFLYTHF